MAKTYIAKALGNLTAEAKVPAVALSRLIASALSDMSADKVRSINDDLDISVFKVPPEVNFSRNRREHVEAHRLAVLISKTIDDSAADKTNSWDIDELGSYIRGYRRDADDKDLSGGPGYYLAGSFWAYSNHNERVTARSAWKEALALCNAGLWVLGAKADERAVRLYQRWFGAADSEAVRIKLHQTLQGLTQRRTSLGYAGKNAAGNTYRLHEYGMNAGGNGIGPVKCDNSPWAYTNQSAYIDYIVLCSKFFDGGNTSRQRTEFHECTLEAGMEVSRGGTILHEATHRFARTNDEKASDAVYQYLNKELGGRARADGYGPFVCAAMAAADPDKAMTNADSYRLFCEDAYVLQTG